MWRVDRQTVNDERERYIHIYIERERGGRGGEKERERERKKEGGERERARTRERERGRERKREQARDFVCAIKQSFSMSNTVITAQSYNSKQSSYTSSLRPDALVA